MRIDIKISENEIKTLMLASIAYGVKKNYPVLVQVSSKILAELMKK